MSVTIDIKGNIIDLISSKLHKAVAEIIKETAEEIRGGAVQLVPVDTGALRDSIRIEPVNDLHTTVIEGNEQTYYGAYVEFGTSRQVAQPHFTPACEAAERYFNRELRSLENRIK